MCSHLATRFALQFAKSTGATVIATTSSNEKAEVLKTLGADHIINYKETEDWDRVALEIVSRGYNCCLNTAEYHIV